jgi:hypothetical protein
MTNPPRTFTLKDRASATVAYGSACRQGSRSERPITMPFGPAGEVLPEGGFEELDATREWLRHVEAGRIG